ncbi:MAG: ribonuclease HII [Alistipes sp.]|nr:ribonuclease HII [Alistipes sp.]
MLKPFYKECCTEAGCDEAGRGCLAGSVFAAAVVLPAGWSHPLLNDSKKMTARARDVLREVIEREATAWAVASVSAARIDQINILGASFEAMTLAVARIIGPEIGSMRGSEADSGVSVGAMGGGLHIKPDMLLIDGNRFRTALDIPYECIVGGDGKYASIAAASVLAKTHRDEYIERLAEEFPEYGWARNKGYPTRQHREAIARHGLSPHHRKTFACLPEPELFERRLP